MPERFLYRFAWDVAKASANRRKHGVSFDEAATVFRDPLALSSAREATAREREQYERG